ncbi:hypothetical protein FALBO_3432 [Fusarium albosuccineum]|uniref:Uncharacterized protein n=1 Tax=Fusarium albosuccineum TaxID=1237068 RepID=A0A8H4LJ18_9HYPO|nr:hypothetical protein FALBO_3432 [Fusarium albosuccineum]
MPSSDRNSSQFAPLLSQDLQSSSVSGFQQQGTVDWIAVANGTVGFSVGFITTFQIGLGKLGEIRLQQAMKKIDAFPSVSNVLWFGFGVKHIIRSMQESAEGLACLGLCARLTEEFSTMLAAKIMRELFLLYNPPAEITPALRQWTSLVEASEGLFAPTEFGLVLHGLTKICLRDGLLNLRGCAPPEILLLFSREFLMCLPGFLTACF